MSQETLLLLLRWVFALAAVVAVIAYIVRPVLRMVRQKPDMDLLTPDYSHMLEGDEVEIPTDEEAAFDRHAIIDQARSDPRATANLLQKWLKERR